MNIESGKRLLDIKETADYLGISINTLYQWVNQRRIDYVKIGRLVKFESETIEKFIEEHKVKKTLLIEKFMIK